MERPQTIYAGFGELPELEPVISHELTDYGWRGLTGDGEVLEVRSQNGHKVEVPEEITVTFRGQAIGIRQITRPPKSIDIDEYLHYFNAAVESYKKDELAAALLYADAAVALTPTLRGRFNRAMILLAMGHWREGFDEYQRLEKCAPFIRPQVKQLLELGAEPWKGENLDGKRILVVHAHGFGDTIQCLRYVRTLQSMGADVVMHVPPELTRLAAQLGMVTANSLEVAAKSCDYFVPFLHLLGRLYVDPETKPDVPYLTAPVTLVDKWRARITGERKRIGLAWSVGKPSAGDYPREIELEQLLIHLDPGAELFSVQIQKPPPGWSAVTAWDFEDFADCAALMLCMDEIVTVDTAAVHLAGAIGHPNVKLLLSKWASWRWVKNWYPNVKICRQTTDGDWASALAQI